VTNRRSHFYPPGRRPGAAGRHDSPPLGRLLEGTPDRGARSGLPECGRTRGSRASFCTSFEVLTCTKGTVGVAWSYPNRLWGERSRRQPAQGTRAGHTGPAWPPLPGRFLDMPLPWSRSPCPYSRRGFYDGHRTISEPTAANEARTSAVPRAVAGRSRRARKARYNAGSWSTGDAAGKFGTPILGVPCRSTSIAASGVTPSR
jgi:hypothetical protein